MLSFLILFLLLIFVTSGVIDILGSKAFHYASILLFFAVIAVAVYFVGVKERTGLPAVQDVEQPKEDETNEKQI